MIVRICLVGPKGVGKTTLASRIDRTIPSDGTQSHLFTSYGNCKIAVGSRSFTLHLSDISGETNLLCMAPILYKGVGAALCVFDLTSKQSFEDLDVFVRGLRQYAAEECVFVIIGNKCDLHTCQSLTDYGMKYATSIGGKFFEVSAKSGKGILDALVYLAKQVYQQNDCYQSYRAKRFITTCSIEHVISPSLYYRQSFIKRIISRNVNKI